MAKLLRRKTAQPAPAETSKPTENTKPAPLARGRIGRRPARKVEHAEEVKVQDKPKIPYEGWTPKRDLHRISTREAGGRKIITCRVSRAHLEKGGHPLHYTIPLVEDLKYAGVPIIGGLAICGVSSGTLTMQYDEGAEDVVITWSDEA